MLPHVVRWNASHAGRRYAELLEADWSREGPRAAERLAERLSALARTGGLPATLRELGVSRGELEGLAADAATQWTGTFNPRPFDAAGALELYDRAF